MKTAEQIAMITMIEYIVGWIESSISTADSKDVVDKMNRRCAVIFKDWEAEIRADERAKANRDYVAAVEKADADLSQVVGRKS